MRSSSKYMKGDIDTDSIWNWKAGINKNGRQRFDMGKVWGKKGKKAEEVVVGGPGFGAGIGCGAGIGLGLVGGFGYGGWPWNHLRLVFGVGMGCGIGLGFGYGQGIGYDLDLESFESFMPKFDSSLSNKKPVMFV